MDLREIRNLIDVTDMELAKLLHLRMEYALCAGKHKAEIRDGEREQQVLKMLKEKSSVLVRGDFLCDLYQRIFAESKALQERHLKLTGFQGEHGAWGEIAIGQYDQQMVPIPHLEFGDVFDGVANGQLDFGVVPVENSLEGAVTEVNDMLVETDLCIVAEIIVPVRQCLLSLPGSDYREIKVVYSHPQALGQCRAFMSRNRLEARPFYDTAGAARWLARERQKSVGVIASALAAELYGLEIIKENISDNPGNFTRFVLLSREKSSMVGNKCSLVFSTQHRAGSLFEFLRIFAEHGINLTRIESRPSRHNVGTYAFLLDFLGSVDDAKVVQALDKARSMAVNFKVLGIYPEAQR